MTLSQINYYHNDKDFDRYFVDSNNLKQGSFVTTVNNVIIASMHYIDNVRQGEAIRYNNAGLWINRSVYVDGVVVYQHTRKINALNLVFYEETIDHSTGSGTTIQLSVNTKIITDISKVGSDEFRDIKEYFLSGELCKQTKTKNGVPHGPVLSYYNSGQLQHLMEFVDGVMHGEVIAYHSNGEINQKHYYLNGKKHSVGETFNSNGEPLMVATFLDGQLHGTRTVYYGERAGQIGSTTEYKNGYKHGVSIKYTRGGKLRQRTYYKEGKRHGRSVTFSTSGKIETILCYKDGQRCGEAKFYAQSGRLKAHYIYTSNDEWELARSFMKRLGIPYNHLKNPTDEEKVMIAMELGDVILLCE